ncbi:N-formylglutamate amidohydrolase [Paraburkholderia piptadeniae]|uniref:N-formylglutamate amidohydrolase n=1 Tax=Paraburkholderia piptadeniae TaxID=1701573 RepID=A0A1N7S2K1_9BURK|nr:N-formylglutamate amidohydrolase [Paraburkholderia piptadeniae]SIT41559.1 N-formylglutamate amidohydrolase [Paraburkholderia piptadeniae]
MMEKESAIVRGQSAVVVVTPHTGTLVPPDLLVHPAWEAVNGRLSDPGGRALGAAARKRGITCISAALHPCVIDLNVAANNTALSQRLNRLGLCRTHTSRGEALYLPGAEPSEADVQRRIEEHWKPFHASILAELSRLRETHDNVLMLVSHAGAWLSPYRTQLGAVDCNFSTNHGASSNRAIVSAMTRAAQALEHSWVVNGSAADAFTAQRYGRPECGVHVIELEVAGRWRRELELAQRNAHSDAESDALIAKILSAAESALDGMAAPRVTGDLFRDLLDACLD